MVILNMDEKQDHGLVSGPMVDATFRLMSIDYADPGSKSIMAALVVEVKDGQITVVSEPKAMEVLAEVLAEVRKKWAGLHSEADPDVTDEMLEAAFVEALRGFNKAGEGLER